MPKKHHIKLEPDERAQLESILRRGKASALKQRHARILLLADTGNPEAGWKDAQIAAAVQTVVGTVERVRRVFVLHGLEKTLERKSAERPYVCKLDGEGEARLLAIACGPAPEGRARWTLRLLADRLVELEVVDNISYESVRRTLKKMKLSPGKNANGLLRQPAAPSS
jgi:transposase